MTIRYPNARKLSRPVILVLITAAVLLSCGKALEFGVPEGFAGFRQSDLSTAVSPEGVAVQARLVDNEPPQTLEFWAETLGRQMKSSGYLPIEESEFESNLGPGALFEWAAPVNDEDWIYLTAIVVLDDQIALVESAGPFEHYQRYRDAIHESLTSLQITRPAAQ